MQCINKYRAGPGRIKPVRRDLHKIKSAAKVQKASSNSSPTSLTPYSNSGIPTKTKRQYSKSLPSHRRVQRITTEDHKDQDDDCLDPSMDSKVCFMSIIHKQTKVIEAHIPPGTVSIHALDDVSLDVLFHVTEKLMGNAGTKVMEPRDVSFALAVIGGIKRQGLEMIEAKTY